MAHLSLVLTDAFGFGRSELKVEASKSVKDVVQMFCEQKGLPAQGAPNLFSNLYQSKAGDLALYDPKKGVLASDRTIASYEIRSRDTLMYYVFPRTGLGYRNIFLERQKGLADVAIFVVVEWERHYYPIILPVELPSPEVEALNLTQIIFEQIAEITGKRVLPADWRSGCWQCQNERSGVWVKLGASDSNRLDNQVRHGDVLRLARRDAADVGHDTIVIVEEEQPAQDQAAPEITIRDDILDTIEIQPIPPVIVNHCKLEIVQGDIIHQDTDAIVNAAKTSLDGGGGVDGAIHKAAGPALVRASRILAPLQPGEAVLTPGFELLARWAIHTVGPVYEGGNKGEARVLANAYRNSLRLAIQSGFQSVAFPAISTGIYRYPVQEAAKVAIESTVETLISQSELSLTVVRFVALDNEVYDGLTDALQNVK